MLKTVPEDNENPSRVLSFTEHLEELRVRIIICVVFFVVSFVAGFFFAPQVVGLLTTPLARLPQNAPQRLVAFRVADDGVLAVDPAAAQKLAHDKLGPQGIALHLPGREAPLIIGAGGQGHLIFLSPIEPFMLLVKGAFLIALIVSLPMVIYQLWLFIAPGLYRRERRIVRPILASSLFLFPLGALFAYGISHIALRVLVGLADRIPMLTPSLAASKYLGFILTLMLLFGAVFEFPLVLLLLSRVGIVSADLLVQKRKYAVLIITVISAVVTPTPDPLTMGAMMLPLVLLYEVSIWIIKVLERRTAAPDTELAENSL